MMINGLVDKMRNKNSVSLSKAGVMINFLNIYVDLNNTCITLHCELDVVSLHMQGNELLHSSGNILFIV